MLLARKFPGVPLIVIETKSGPYTRPIWQMDLEYAPKEIRSLPISLDFTDPDAFVRTLDAADFVAEDLAIEPEEVPLCGTGRRTVEIMEFGIGKDIQLHELIRQFGLGRRHCVFCPPLGAVVFAQTVKGGVLEHPLTTVFTGPGSLLYYLTISNVVGGMGIKIAHAPIGLYFGGNLNFLVVDRANDPTG